MNFKGILEGLREKGLFRRIKNIERISGKYIYEGGREYLDFSSSNYLGYRDSEWMKKTLVDAVKRYGVGSGASRLVVGTADIYGDLEELLARKKKQERALLFNSGYDANIGIISTLYGKDDVIYCDKLNHASIYDGIKMSGAHMVRYLHNDMEDLEKKIVKTREKYERALIVVDSVFSMEGDKAPLRKLVDLKERYNIELMVDEAHGGGVLGRDGMGASEEAGVLERIDINMGTFSKAYGSQGAYVASSEDIIDYLINRCRSLIYTTSLPPAVIACNLEAVKRAEGDREARERLGALSDYLRSELEKIGMGTLGSETNIIPIVVGDNERTLWMSERLREEGIMIPAIRKPTVTTPRLRASLSANHSIEDVDRLIGCLKRLKSL